MKFKICKNRVIGTLCYDYCDIVEYSMKSKNSWPFRNVEQVMNLLAKENGLTCYYYNDFIDNSFFIELYGSVTNMLRYRSSIKYLFGFKEKKMSKSIQRIMVRARTAKELINDACELFDYAIYSEGRISFSGWLDILSRVTLGEKQFDIDEFWTMALSAWERKTKEYGSKNSISI